MGKALAGVKYGKMTSRQKPPQNTKSQGRMSGRSGPPMVDIGSKGERKGTAQTVREGTPHRFAKTGNVSQSNSHSGPSDHPTIGAQKGHGGFGEFGIRKSR